MAPRKTSPKDYWTALKGSNRVPNWWMTPEYVLLAGLVWAERGDLAGWVDPTDPDTWFLPPLGPGRFVICRPTFAGFPDEPGLNGEFLDHQYIYDARKFLDLTGSQWKIHRKNIRKYPQRAGGELVYRELVLFEWQEEVGELLEAWAGNRTLQDPDTIVSCVLLGSNRWGLFRDGVLVGVNVGDENHLHAIYRYCIDNGTPHLNEYLRHLFFISPWVQKRRWVNDGGDLGNPGLERFKRRLNPVQVYDIYSSAPI